MSFEAGVGAVEAVGQSAKQSPAENHQAALVGGNDHLAQTFESGLMRASEAAAASFQAAEEARRKTSGLAVSENLNLPEATQIDVRPSDDRGSLGKGVATYMHGFQERTSGYSAELDDFLTKVSEGARINGGGSAETSSTGVSVNGNLPSSQDLLHMVQRSFQFAIEAELVSNASKHSTQVFNDLMKGQ